ncbi:hypothetical protein ACFQ0M_18915 [Kitasatospora aburaviensis]
MDGRCRPSAFVLTAGQAGDAPAFTAVMARPRVPRPVDGDRPTPASAEIRLPRASASIMIARMDF